MSTEQLPSALRELPKVSVGRMVHYWDAFGTYDHGTKEISPKAAVVTFVHDNGTVDLHVHYPARQGVVPMIRVPPVRDDREKKGRWSWPQRM